jgi:hypothetical protein
MADPSDSPRPNAINSGDVYQPLSEKDRKKFSRREQRFIAWSEVFLGFAIMVATVAQAVIGKFQWDAMAEQNAKIDRQMGQADRALSQTDATLSLMRAEMSPSLAIGDATLESPLKANSDLSIEFTVRHAGGCGGTVYFTKALAFPVRPRDFDAHLLDITNQASASTNGFEFCSMRVPQGDKVSFGPRTANAITKADVAEIENGTKILYFALQIGYVSQLGDLGVVLCICKYNKGARTMPVVFSDTDDRLTKDQFWEKANMQSPN